MVESSPMKRAIGSAKDRQGKFPKVTNDKNCARGKKTRVEGGIVVVSAAGLKYPVVH